MRLVDDEVLEAEPLQRRPFPDGHLVCRDYHLFAREGHRGELFPRKPQQKYLEIAGNQLLFLDLLALFLRPVEPQHLQIDECEYESPFLSRYLQCLSGKSNSFACLQGGHPALKLVAPIGQRRLGADDDVWPGYAPDVFQVAEQRDGLQRLAQALRRVSAAKSVAKCGKEAGEKYHFVCKDAVDATVVQLYEPIEAHDLVRAHFSTFDDCAKVRDTKTFKCKYCVQTKCSVRMNTREALRVLFFCHHIH